MTAPPDWLVCELRKAEREAADCGDDVLAHNIDAACRVLTGELAQALHLRATVAQHMRCEPLAALLRQAAARVGGAP